MASCLCKAFFCFLNSVRVNGLPSISLKNCLACIEVSAFGVICSWWPSAVSALGVDARNGDGGLLSPLLLDDSLDESLLESDVPSVPSVSLVVAPSLEVSSEVDVSGLVVPSVSLAALLSAGGTLSGTLS